MQQIQLPQGMKDTILQECEKKKYLQNTLEQIFESFGYEEIMRRMKMHLKIFKRQICINFLMRMEEF